MKILDSTCNLQRNAKRARKGEGGREKLRERVLETVIIVEENQTTNEKPLQSQPAANEGFVKQPCEPRDCFYTNVTVHRFVHCKFKI